MMDLSQQQQLAKMLMQQGMQSPQGQVVSGQYVKSSPLQYFANMANLLAGKSTEEAALKKEQDLAKLIRQESQTDAERILRAQMGTPAVPATPEKYTELAGPYDSKNKMPLAYMEAKPAQAAIPGSNQAALIEALRGRSPVAQGMAQTLQKQLTEGPDWKEGKLEQPDGSTITGWYNAKAPNPRATFIPGGNKPAYSPLDAEKFYHETGRYPPGYQPGQPNTPVQQSAPTQVVPNAPVQNAPQGSLNQNAMPVSNRVAAAPMSYQAGNQPITATGNTVPVSAMNRPGMSPKDLSEANKQVYAKSEEQRQADLKALPANIEQANMAIKTIDEMIGDARLNDKGEIVYQKYDPVSKKYVEGKQPHGGFESYVGAGFPGLRFIEGTDTASFEPLYKSIKGQAFLDAFQRLKGGGQITEIDGQKATEALLKLDKAQNEKDFVKYAREFQENLQRGMELAKNKAGVSKEYRSPVNQPALRWNPQTNSWVNQ
jgi:hypothetical protein